MTPLLALLHAAQADDALEARATRTGHKAVAGSVQGGETPLPSTVLAMGIIVTRWVPVFRRRTLNTISWRYVTTERTRETNPLFLVVDCPDIFFGNATKYVPGNRNKVVMGFQFSCFCKTAAWFRAALTLEPTAKFIGKMEDDSVLHDSRVMAELIYFQRLARRESQWLGLRKPLPLWYGHFAWALFYSNGRARFCGDADDHLVETYPHNCAKHVQTAGASGVLAPFASGGLDVRARSLVEQIAKCEEIWDFIRGFDVTNVSYQASCDGQHGYFVARCLTLRRTQSGASATTSDATALSSASSAPPWSVSSFSTITNSPGSPASSSRDADTRLATLLHLPWPKFHKPNAGNGPRLHSSILHPHRVNPKQCGVRPPAAGEAASTAGKERGCASEMPLSWRWNLGHGLLPFHYTLHGSLAEGGARRTTWWQPRNRSLLKLYNRLHAHREDDKYCDVLPCGVAAAAAAVPGKNKSMALRCSSMHSCFASNGEGGRYFYLHSSAHARRQQGAISKRDVDRRSM